MACVKSVKKVIESVRGTVNPYYDMGCDKSMRFIVPIQMYLI
jgi:hypothetical protein